MSEDVTLTNLDQPLFEGATKRDLVEYLDAMHPQLLPVLRDRPLTVVRILRGQGPFMQKNLPKYTPEWVASVNLWADSSQREVRYALCNDHRTLLWFANQRAVEYHTALIPLSGHQTHLIMDIDPPEGGDFSVAVAGARLVREALRQCGLDGAVKTSGAKGLHIFVPIEPAPIEDVAAATRAVGARAERLDPEVATTAFLLEDRHGKVFLDSTRAAGNTVIAAYSPRLRPGLPVSFPAGWDNLDGITPADFTVHNVPALLDGKDPWAEQMPEPQHLPADLVAEGHTIPIARVAAMHDGKRRARARRT